MKFLILLFIASSAYSFTCVNQTQKIFEQHKAMKSIKDDSFENCKDVMLIDFSHNYLTEIPRNLFRKTILLKEMRFAHNAIYALDRDFFEELHNLEIIDFSYNRLVYFHFPSLAFTTVRNLDISHNRIVNIRSTTICNLPYLK